MGLVGYVRRHGYGAMTWVRGYDMGAGLTYDMGTEGPGTQGPGPGTRDQAQGPGTGTRDQDHRDPEPGTGTRDQDQGPGPGPIFFNNHPFSEALLGSSLLL